MVEHPRAVIEFLRQNTAILLPSFRRSGKVSVFEGKAASMQSEWPGWEEKLRFSTPVGTVFGTKKCP